jgi:copper chaperone CopZ
MSAQDRTLTIDGMHCDHCVDRVEEVLTDLDGVTVRSVDIGSAEVSVDAEAVSDDEIAAVLDDAGYALSA